MSELTYISLFSSAGVGCYGFHQENYKCIATNEIIPRRLDIQRSNRKCERDQGYVCGDITEKEIKNKIIEEVDWWKKNKKLRDITVVIATPPCQGMSVVNHKKKEADIYRNSLVVESLQMVKTLQPLFFLFENVPAFMKTICIIDEDQICSIGEAHDLILGSDYVFYSDTLNFKLFGSKSSRTRTLVVGVHKKLSRFISPIELFPDRETELTLRDVIGCLPPLTKMGEISEQDIYHSFRSYPDYMRLWISGLAQCQSAFDNVDANRRPYKIDKNGLRIENTNKSRHKYTRQCWDKVAPTVHTRNDQLASQNTIHPSDDRVFSIRELMLMMSIPESFRWNNSELSDLNSLSEKLKRAYLKKEEMNIRQCIGEAVPTRIFNKIAFNIAQFMGSKKIVDQQIRKIISSYNLEVTDNLVSFIISNIRNGNGIVDHVLINNATLSRVAELANTARMENAAYYTEKETLTTIFEHLPYIDSDTIRILEPAAGTCNFVPFLVKKYAYAQTLIIDVIDIDEGALKIAEQLLNAYTFPNNVHINIIIGDFMETDIKNVHYNLIIGNPPYLKLPASKTLKKYRVVYNDKYANNLAAYFVEKSCLHSDYVAFILPKIFLCNSEYFMCREKLNRLKLDAIIDFGEHGFSGINIETMFLLINTQRKSGNVLVKSVPRNEVITQRQSYICSRDLPNWVIYRNAEFDRVMSEKRLGVFNVFRDRQITKKLSVKRSTVLVIKSKNIPRDGKAIINIEKGKKDFRLNRTLLRNFSVYEYIDRDDVFLVPNMTYYPRMVKKPIGVVTDGSVAILIPKEGISVSDKDVEFIATKEFEDFYRIARNHATRSLNIDAVSVYYFCISK